MTCKQQHCFHFHNCSLILLSHFKFFFFFTGFTNLTSQCHLSLFLFSLSVIGMKQAESENWANVPKAAASCNIFLFSFFKSRNKNTHKVNVMTDARQLTVLLLELILSRALYREIYAFWLSLSCIYMCTSTILANKRGTETSKYNLSPTCQEPKIFLR